ncbi:glutamate--cysteine ligase [Streptomyces albus subsp. chlorinus]|uniref:glutamate-cysteine ligase family protein n=1 Tax=Streptomyces albus TaxID=1888 RepID=UPI00156D69B9|nr:glutamate-cysteine ligase family protein [Streptomyces albus]NSC24989.1 glutamate--cysteine ligase [Streptomyces albus subsp. chlorinus]
MAHASAAPSLTRDELRSVFTSAFADATGDDGTDRDSGSGRDGGSGREAGIAAAHGTAGTAHGTARELVGIEVETAALDPRTGAAVPYRGPRGVRALLEFLAAERPGAVPLFDRAALVGVALPEGGTVTLEHGGAVEYSSPPCRCVGDLAEVTDRALRELAAAADRFGFALVPGAQYPFTAPGEVEWVPHSRTPVMRRHFERLGPPGADGVHVMSLALSTQVSLDFCSPGDLTRKLRAQAAASTPAAALFVNAPLDAGQPCGLLSRRMDHLSRTDPARTGVVPAMLREDVDIDQVVDWALALPMIHRAAPDGGRRAVPRVPFATLLTEGFGDGTAPDLADWRAHLSQVFSDVRLRETLELRAVDGPPYRALFAPPAFWSGLGYHPPSREAAWELLRGIGPEAHRAALREIARHGLAARLAGRPVRALATALLELSAAGLTARIADGRERPEALAFLEPLREVAEEGTTFAELTLADLGGGPDGFPARHIARHRIPRGS